MEMSMSVVLSRRDAPARLDQHVGQDGNGVAPLDHALDMGQRAEEGSAFDGNLHGNLSALLSCAAPDCRPSIRPGFHPGLLRIPDGRKPLRTGAGSGNLRRFEPFPDPAFRHCGAPSAAPDGDYSRTPLNPKDNRSIRQAAGWPQPPSIRPSIRPPRYGAGAPTRDEGVL